MLIEDLPPLSEEEREIVDDGYVVMPGAPTIEPRKLRFRLARILAAIVTALALTACSPAPRSPYHHRNRDRSEIHRRAHRSRPRRFV